MARGRNEGRRHGETRDCCDNRDGTWEARRVHEASRGASTALFGYGGPARWHLKFLTPHDDPDSILLYELYESPEAFDLHWNGPSGQQVRKEAQGLSLSLPGTGCALIEQIDSQPQIELTTTGPPRQLAADWLNALRAGRPIVFQKKDRDRYRWAVAICRANGDDLASSSARGAAWASGGAIRTIHSYQATICRRYGRSR